MFAYTEGVFFRYILMIVQITPFNDLSFIMTWCAQTNDINIMKSHVFLSTSSKLFGWGNYEIHWLQTHFWNMLCSCDLYLLLCNIEFVIRVFQYSDTSSVPAFMTCVCKLKLTIQGHPTIVDCLVDLTFLTQVFTNVEYIFPQKSALMHNYKGFWDLSNCRV